MFDAGKLTSAGIVYRINYLHAAHFITLPKTRKVPDSIRRGILESDVKQMNQRGYARGKVSYTLINNKGTQHNC